MVADLEVGRGPFPRDGDPSLAELHWLHRVRSPGEFAWRDRVKVPYGQPQGLFRHDVADDDERRVVGDVEPPVVPVQVVTGHRLQIREPPDRRMSIRMRLKRRRGYLLIEQCVGIVLAAL